MPRSRFVTPNTVQLDLSDGDWVKVKERLNNEETLRVNNVFEGYRNGDELAVDFAKQSLVRLHTWIVDWSFRDENGRVVPVSWDAIRNLDPDTATEIHEAINKHVKALEEASKNPPTAPGSTTG
jgi:hypothetical protein